VGDVHWGRDVRTVGRTCALWETCTVGGTCALWETCTVGDVLCGRKCAVAGFPGDCHADPIRMGAHI
jgi:hypothetical protein